MVGPPDGTVVIVEQCIERLSPTSSSSPLEKENSSRQLLDLIITREDAVGVVGSHPRAFQVLVHALRHGSIKTQIQTATVLCHLSKDEKLPVKLLLGGVITPLLGLLKSTSDEGQVAAAKTILAISQVGDGDHIVSEIFSTEVVPVLWQQLEKGLEAGNYLVGDLLERALRNLCSSTKGFCSATIEAGGVDTLLKLLTVGQSSSTQANVCFLLARMMMEDASVCTQVLNAKATKLLLELLRPVNEASVRADAAAALKSLSARCKESNEQIINANGHEVLITTIAPSKEHMRAEFTQRLQEDAMSVLANIFGGISRVIKKIIQGLESNENVADALGALGYALKIYDTKAEENNGAPDPKLIEKKLVRRFEFDLYSLEKDRAMEALESLYGNAILGRSLVNSEAKRLLIRLISMATNHQEEENLVRTYYLILSDDEISLLKAFEESEGIRLLIHLLDISSEQQQECAVSLLSLVSHEKESITKIISTGCIPHVVRILKTGSAKAKEDAATIIGNLSDHSNTVRGYITSDDAVPSLVSLLKSASVNGGKIAAKTLSQIIHKSDTATMNQLTALLTSDLPESKIYVLEALQNALSVATSNNVVHESSSAEDNAIKTMIEILSSTKEETQAKSARALAAIFYARKDLRESITAVETVRSLMGLLKVDSETVLVEASHCLAVIFLSIKENHGVAVVALGALRSLVALAKSSKLQVAEEAICALANLLLDSEASGEAAIPEDIIPPATKVLREGTNVGKIHASAAIARLLGSRRIDSSATECLNRTRTVLALVSFLEGADTSSVVKSEALDALDFLSRPALDVVLTQPAVEVLANNPGSVSPIVSCIADATPLLQDKVIEILSRLCKAQAVELGNIIAHATGCISSIATRVTSSLNTRVRIGGAALLVCGAEAIGPQRLVEVLYESNVCTSLVCSLVQTLNSTEDGDQGSNGIISIFTVADDTSKHDKERSCTSIIRGASIAVWLLCALASYDPRAKIAIIEAGAVGILIEKVQAAAAAAQSNYKEDGIGSTWVCTLLLAILFQNSKSPHAEHSVNVLANYMSRTNDVVNIYFAAQAMASLVSNGSREAMTSAANSGAPKLLLSLLGCANNEINDLVELSKGFNLICDPSKAVLENLFSVDSIRDGATSRKAIPFLVDLLRPVPDRPGAPFLALGFLIQLADRHSLNQTAMVESGALERLIEYISLSPQDASEKVAIDLLAILFSTREVRGHSCAFDAVGSLVEILRYGEREAKHSAAKALEILFSSDDVRRRESSRHAVQPLVNFLTIGQEEKEQQVAVAALVRLLREHPSRNLIVFNDWKNAAKAVCKILSSKCSMQLKENAAELCCVLFCNSRALSTEEATACVKPLVELIASRGGNSAPPHSFIGALDKLLDEKEMVETVDSYGAVTPLVRFLHGRNYSLHETISRVLVKLGKDRPGCQREMVRANVIEKVLRLLDEAPVAFHAAFADLLSILTYNTIIATSASVVEVVEPFFRLLGRSECRPDEHRSALQVLVNILKHKQCRDNYALTPEQCIEPLEPLLISRDSASQQLAAELLSYLLLEDHLQKDPLTKNVIGPLVRTIGSRNPISQQLAVSALLSIAAIWPDEIANKGGVRELSNFILGVDPSPQNTTWESVAFVFCNILQFGSQWIRSEVPVTVLVRLLHSSIENMVPVALEALLMLKSDPTRVVEMAEHGAIAVLLDILKRHQFEETAAVLLQALLANSEVRNLKVTGSAILPLSEYILDPQIQTDKARFIATIALGNLFEKHELTQNVDAVSACQALVSFLKNQSKSEMKVVAIRAMQNLVRTNYVIKKNVEEAGGVRVGLDLLDPSDPASSVEAARFIAYFFSNHYYHRTTDDTVRDITNVIKKDFETNGTVNHEYIRALKAVLPVSNVRSSTPATECIPYIVTALQTGQQDTQVDSLDVLLVLSDGWPQSQKEVYQPQSIAVAAAIPILYDLIQSDPFHFQAKAKKLINRLPGRLEVTIIRGENFKYSIANPNLQCKLSDGTNEHTTPVISTGPNPTWDDQVSWSYDSPPKGQKLHIECKNKRKWRKSTFGEVFVDLDIVLATGLIKEWFVVKPPSKNGEGKLELELKWSPPEF